MAERNADATAPLPDRYIDLLIKHGPKQTGQVVHDLAVEIRRLRRALAQRWEDFDALD